MPRSLNAKIQACLHPRLLKPDWRRICAKEKHPTARKLCGHCYVAAEAAYYLLGGKASGCVPMKARDRQGTHWWLACPTGRVDPTAGQYLPGKPPYKLGERKAWVSNRKNAGPSKRAREVMACVRKLR